VKKTKLGVMSQGPTTLGYPFNKLFSFTVPILTYEDLEKERPDAVILWGGEDISPSLYGQEVSHQFCDADNLPSKRDLVEWKTMQECARLQIPIIGICRGAQILCAFDGGKLAQDVAGHLSGHPITTIDGEVFHAPANHHQMLLPREEARLLAWASQRRAEFYIGEENTIHNLPMGFKEPEAVYFPDLNSIGFQYHPEWDKETSKCVNWTFSAIEEYVL
jgi:gamma-glutamyl-gamma-aminobutyrate hydrolase PuuD